MKADDPKLFFLIAALIAGLTVIFMRGSLADLSNAEIQYGRSFNDVLAAKWPLAIAFCLGLYGVYLKVGRG